MDSERYDGDTLACMEQLGVGVGEILQYARTVLPRRKIRLLIENLDEIVNRGPAAEPTREALHRDEILKPMADAVSDHAG